MNSVKLIGGLTNGILITKDNKMIFLPYDPMRQYRNKASVCREIKDLLEKHAEGK